MFKMTIELDQHKLQDEGLTIYKTFEQIHRLMEISDMTVVEEGCYEYDSDCDMTPMIAISFYLSKCSWFSNSVSSWKFYNNEERNDLLEEWIYG